VIPQRDVESIESIASVLALGASRHSFQQMAVFDPGTKLYNRRWLETHLPAELDRSRRYAQSLAILALDFVLTALMFTGGNHQ